MEKTLLYHYTSLSHLIEISDTSLGVYEQGNLVGFVICLFPNVDYSSPNYAWFNDNYTNFLYVDRISVCEKYRNKKIGSLLYE